MFTLQIKGPEVFDEETNEFTTLILGEVRLEHSLVSLSKWEQKFEKPLLREDNKTSEETLWYIRAMSLDENVPEEWWDAVTDDDVREVNEYIGKKMTATWFAETAKPKNSSSIYTNELIYYLMIAHNIPIACETWHLNRLLTLIRVCDEKNSPPKKMSQAEIMERNRRLNQERRAAMGSTG